MKVVVLGSTGAVGTELVRALIAAPRVEAVTLLVRRPHGDPTVRGSKKVAEAVVDVFDPASYRAHVAGHDSAFSTFGVGEPSKISKEEFVRVDADAVKAFAKECKAAGVGHFSSLGSVGAHRKSKVFYLRIKGQLEQSLVEMRFPRLSLFQPSMILTPTNRYGISQGILLKVYPWLDPLFPGPLAKFRGVRVEDLGRAMAQNALLEATAPVETLTWKDFRRVLRAQ